MMEKVDSVKKTNKLVEILSTKKNIKIIYLKKDYL